jgi:GAF domain-containing protein
MNSQKLSAQKRSADIQCHFLRTLSAQSESDDLLKYIAEQVTVILEASACSIYIVNENGKTATLRAGTGYQKNLVGKVTCQVLPEYQVVSNPKPEEKIGITGWIISTGKTFLARIPEELDAHPHRMGVHDPDMLPDNRLSLQTFLGVPIRGQYGEIIGIIKAERRYDSGLTSQPFSVDQQIILETIARVTSKTLGYLETSRTRNVDAAITAWSRDLIAEASTTESDMDGFLSIVVNVTAAAMHADSCGIYLIDLSKNTLTQRAGIGSQQPRYNIRSYFLPRREQIVENPHAKDKVGVTAWIAATGKSFYARNRRELSAHPHHRGYYDARNFENLTECGAFLGGPLQVAGIIVGVLKVENIAHKGMPDAREFNEDAQHRFDVLAQDIALAIVDLQHRASEPYQVIIDAQQTIFEILRGGQDVAILAGTAVKRTMQLLQARACSLYLKEGEYLVQPEWAAAGYAQIGYSQNRPLIRKYKLVDKNRIVENPASEEQKVGLTVWIATMRQKFTARSNTELRLHPHHLGTFDKFNFDKEKKEQCESFMGVPLIVGDELVGVFKVESKKKIGEGGNEEYTYFSEQDELVFDLIAKSVAIAIENAKLSEARRLAEQILAQTHRLLPDLHEFVKDNLQSVETLTHVANAISGRKANIAQIIENYAAITLPNFPLRSLDAIAELMVGLGEVLEGGRAMGLLYRELYRALLVSSMPELVQFCAQSRLSNEVQFGPTQFFLAEPAARFFRIVEDTNQSLQGEAETRFSLDSALTHLEAAREQVSLIAVPERGILLRIIDLWQMIVSTARGKFVKIANPYVVGAPVDPNSSPFFGRRDVFNWISENLYGAHQKNILVFHGERRVGKTSVLLQLQRGVMGRSLRDDPKRPICPIFIDLQGFSDDGTYKFLYHFYNLVYKQAIEYSPALGKKLVPPDIRTFEQTPFSSFQEYIKNTCKALGNTLLVLMMDEFERLDDLVKAGKVEKNIYDQFRSLMQFEENLTFILAGTHELEELSDEYRGLVHNIALIREISFMDKQDAIDLIRQPVAGLVSYEDNAVDELWRYTHGHPYLLQRLCFDLISDMNRRGDGNFIALGHVNNIIQYFVEKHDLDALWERCSEVDKVILYKLAESTEKRQRGMSQLELSKALNAFSEDQIVASLTRLIKRALVEKSADPSGGVEFIHAIRLFSRWLVENAPLTEEKRQRTKASPGKEEI